MAADAVAYHVPALLEQCIEGLDIKPSGVYVDATFGGGGHSRAIMQRLGPSGHLYGFDQDIDAQANSIDDDRFTFVHSNFAFLPNFMRFCGVKGVDGILADLGVSFHHFDDAARGFSFRFDAPLDMRMNQSSPHDASWLLANYDEQRLANVLYLYGELRQSRRMAAAIVKAREAQPIATTGQLVDIVKPLVSRKNEKKEIAQVFQALRIEVNHELSALERLLQAAVQVLVPGGRLAIITYHSLEDRLVKNFMRSGNLSGKVEKDFYGNAITPWKVVTGKVITPTPSEVERNPRSRSAKLRIAQRI